MTDEYSHGNGNVLRSEIKHLQEDVQELFTRLRKAEDGNTTSKVLLEGYMNAMEEIKNQISLTNSKLSSIEKKLTKFDIDQAKKWTKIAVLGGVGLFIITSVPGIVFTIMKIIEMGGN